MVRKIGYSILAIALCILVIYVHYSGSRKIEGLTVDFWYESLYTAFVLIMGIPVLLKYRHKRYFAIRTVTVMIVQLFFGYLLSYFILPDPIRGSNGPGTTLYGPFLQNFWPLEINGLLIGKYIPLNPIVIGWLIYVIGTSLVLMPVIVMRYGRAYCSWFCGCGALAETAGDPFRTQSPKGPMSSQFEWLMAPMVLFAVIATISVLFGWGNIPNGQTGLSIGYDYWGKFVLAGIIGITTYPLLGPRIWCRYFCPWAGLFGVISKWGRAGIAANDMCMGCGLCNKHCEMGIDIRVNALKGQVTKTTSCVYCGACAAVCPRRVLRMM